LSLNSPPINPPTYFIRDLFMIFILLEIVINKNFKLLPIVVVYAIFGKVLLRYDILMLFSLGYLYAKYSSKINLKVLIFILSILIILSFKTFEHPYQKHIVATLLFVIIINIKMKFINTGGYTYLLHLYHSPIIIIAFIGLSKFISDDIELVIAQFVCVIVFITLFHLIKNKLNLKFITGGR